MAKTCTESLKMIPLAVNSPILSAAIADPSQKNDSWNWNNLVLESFLNYVILQAIYESHVVYH